VAVHQAFRPGHHLVAGNMVDNPLLVLLVAAALFLFFLAVFVIFTYLVLKMAADLKREGIKKK
jgi:hypothetical protein